MSASYSMLKKSFLIKDILHEDHQEEEEEEEENAVECLTCFGSQTLQSNDYLFKSDVCHPLWSTTCVQQPSNNWSSALYGKSSSLYGLYYAAVAGHVTGGHHLDAEVSEVNESPHQQSIALNSSGSSDGANCGRKVRRNRTVFTELQLMGLERRFDSQKYLSTPDRAELARALGLTQLQVKTWYQNRRMKWKKQVMQNGCPIPPTKPKGRPKKNSIPSLGLLDTSALMSGHPIGQLAISSGQKTALEATIAAALTAQQFAH